MTVVICSKVDPYSVWVTFSEVASMFGERFAVALRLSYPYLYRKYWNKEYVPDPKVEETFQLDLVFHFVNEFYDKQE